MACCGSGDCGLFAYGTLQVPEVMERVLGRALTAVRATLLDHACFSLRGRVYPAIVERPGAAVEGIVYSGVGEQDLELLDLYEGSLYERRQAAAVSAGAHAPAFIYVLRAEHHALLDDKPWDLETFRREHLSPYLALLGEGARAPFT